MKMQNRLLAVLAVALVILTTGPLAFGQDQHVRWDITSVDFTTKPITVRAGGFADAIAPNNGGRIRLTGSSTFVVSADRGGANTVTGGGTWQTFDPSGSGTYVVSELVRFELATFQTPGSIIDKIGDQAEAANGYAVLRIEYDDGSQGVLGVYCHGPGAPDGVAEGISATKGFKTYVGVQDPAPGVDSNRTLFHVRQ